MENPNNTPMDMDTGSSMNNKKNIIIGVVVAVVVIIIGWFLFAKKVEAPSTDVVDTVEDGEVVVDANMPAPGNAGVNEMVVEKEVVAPAISNAVVYYTNNGFEPKVLTISPGRIVTFVNQSDNKMWVASNDHPSHEIFSEFDQKTSVEKGGIYTFTFNDVGSWDYHNHSKAGDGGTIIVQ